MNNNSNNNNRNRGSRSNRGRGRGRGGNHSNSNSNSSPFQSHNQNQNQNQSNGNQFGGNNGNQYGGNNGNGGNSNIGNQFGGGGGGGNNSNSNRGGGRSGGRNSRGGGRGFGGGRGTGSIDGNVMLQCNCRKDNCPKFHCLNKLGDIRGQNNVAINAVALCNDHIVCAGSDGTLAFYDAEYRGVHVYPTGGSCIKYLVAETFMGKDLLFWSVDYLIPNMGGVPVGVIQMMDFASLSVPGVEPPTVTVMRSTDVPYTHPQSILKFIVLSSDTDLNLISSGEEGTLRTWNFNAYTSTFDHIHCYEGHLRGVSGLAFNVNQTHLWSSSMDYTVRVWSLETNSLIKTFTAADGGHTDKVTCLTRSEDSQFIISGGMDSMLIVYESATATQCYKGNQGNIVASVSCVAMSTDEVLLYVGLVNGNIIIRTSQDVFFSAIIIDHTAMAHSSVVRQILPIPSQNGTAYLSCGDDGRVVHMDFLTAQQS